LVGGFDSFLHVGVCLPVRGVCYSIQSLHKVTKKISDSQPYLSLYLQISSSGFRPSRPSSGSSKKHEKLKLCSSEGEGLPLSQWG
jgi:hypothetical protein